FLSCILSILCLMTALNNYDQRSSDILFAQSDQRNTRNVFSGPGNIEGRDSFSAIGQISSLVITVPDSDFNITNAFKVILTGEWNLSIRNGSVTNFDVNFLASPMDGRGTHVHQISNFKPYDNDMPIRLSEDNSVIIRGTADIKINGVIIWDQADLSISISNGNIFNIDPDDADTENHFGGQQVYGIVTRLI
ncbi:MAG: hypothetical protein ACRD4J_01555, partial [Nitrososphaeraceae archaeon]